MIKKIIIILIISGIFLPSFSFTQKGAILNPPESLEELKEIGKRGIMAIPEILKKIWKEEFLPFFQKIYNWLKGKIWDSFVGPFFKKEIEKRGPVIKEEFKKEKKELKEEFPKLKKSLWERFKELIR